MDYSIAAECNTGGRGRKRAALKYLLSPHETVPVLWVFSFPRNTCKILWVSCILTEKLAEDFASRDGHRHHVLSCGGWGKIWNSAAAATKETPLNYHTTRLQIRLLLLLLLILLLLTIKFKYWKHRVSRNRIYTHTLHSTRKVCTKIFKLRSDSDLSYAQ